MESHLVNSISNKLIKHIEMPLNKTFSFLFMGLLMSMVSIAYAEEKKENGGRGELTSNMANACFKTQSQSVSEVCASYRIRWKMWSLMGEPVGNYSLDWQLKSITLTAESKGYSSPKPSWNFTPATLPAELKKSVDAIELFVDGAASVDSPGINWNQNTAHYHHFDTGVAVRANKGASHNVPGSPDWNKVFIKDSPCTANAVYASVADAKKVFINGFKFSNLQVCSKSAVYNLSALESKIYELCQTEEGSKKYKFCPKKNEEVEKNKQDNAIDDAFSKLEGKSTKVENQSGKSSVDNAFNAMEKQNNYNIKTKVDDIDKQLAEAETVGQEREALRIKNEEEQRELVRKRKREEREEGLNINKAILSCSGSGCYRK